MSFGFTGNILRVDLSKHSYFIEHPNEKFYRTYFGGRSIALFYMLKEMKPKLNPFSENNLLIFVTSVLVGTIAPGINRYTVCSKSPLTLGQGEAEAGGFFGPELKRAGFDAIIIKGKSIKPIYIYINGHMVHFRDATHLWGKDTGIVDKIIKEELESKGIKIAQIGPAGENLVRYANIVNELSHFNGRNGLGAVMGSKKLKAIAIKGVNSLNVFDNGNLERLSRKIFKRTKEDIGCKNLGKLGTIRLVKQFNEQGWLPSRNWTGDGSLKKWENLWAESLNRRYLKKYGSCYGCPINCKRIVSFQNEDFEVNPIFGGPEYETVAALGSLCGIDDLKYVIKGSELCNKYTMDTISTGSSIAFAMHCFENGILTKHDTYGINLKFGNKEAMLEMIQKIAFREKGLGDLLAEGTYRASNVIGNGSEQFIRQVKGQEIPMHDPRVKVGLGLQYALSTYGADHMKALHDTYFQNWDSPGIREMNQLGPLEPLEVTDISYKKVKIFKLSELLVSLYDILGICDFTFAPYSIGSTMKDLINIVYLITGWETSWYELLEVSERSINMAQIFNIREGFSPKDDTIPDIFYENFNKGILKGTGAINKNDFQSALKYRYQIMNWDSYTGRPSIGKLKDLDLDWLINHF